MKLKRFIILLLGMALIPVGAKAQTEEAVGSQVIDVNNQEPKVTYYVSKNTPNANEHYECSVRPASGAKGEVNIPATIVNRLGHTFDVVLIERFGQNTSAANSITKITLPEGLKTISKGAFSRSYGLTEIIIPSTLELIEDDGTFFECPLLSKITVAEGNTYCKTIEDGKALVSYDGTEMIYFLAANGETEYTVPSSIKTIRQGAFTSSPTLKTLNIPSTVETITIPAIYYNKVQTAINVDEANANYSSVDSVLYDKAGTSLLTFPYYKGTGQKNFGTGGNTNLRNWQWYDIDDSKVTTVDKNAFLWCDKLNEVSFVQGLETIKDQAFSNCASLQVLNLPCTLTSLDEDANGDPFFRCNSLKEFNIVGECEDATYGSIDGVLTSGDKKTLIKYPLAYQGGTDYTGAKDNNGRALEYTIPASIETIALKAFNNSVLENVVIPNTVKTVEQSAFADCTKLKAVTYEATCQITEIAKNTFQGCTALTEITIPSSIETIGEGAFYNCKGLTTATVEGTTLTTIANQAFANCESLTTFEISADCPLTSIGGGAFSNNKSLTSFTLPKSVTDLGALAFSSCTNLETFTFAPPASITNLGGNVFKNCEGLTEIQLPEGLTTIGNQAFYECTNLQDVTIPASVTSIGTQSFEYCKSMQNFIVAEGNTKFSTVDGMLTTKDGKTLYTMPSGRAQSDYTLLPTIETIGAQSCYRNDNLTNIAIPSSVKTIKANAFELCKNLKYVTCMGADAPALETGAFNNALTSDAVLYYRKKDAETYKTWGSSSFKTRHPSFNYAYNDESAGRKANAKDLVEYIPMSDNTVCLVANQSTEESDSYKTSEKTTLIIPAQVTDHFNNTTNAADESVTNTYDVKLVYDYAFNSNASVHTITFFGPIEYIGVNAFYKKNQSGKPDVYFTQDLPENLVFAQDKYELGADYVAFANDQNVYVRKSQLEGYKAAFNTEAHPCNVDYKIPVKVSSTVNGWKQYLATICREFPISFAEINNGTEKSIRPFMPFQYQNYQDKVNGYTALVRAQSIDSYEVPAWTGVVLYDKKASDGTQYYEMMDAEPTLAVSGGTPALIGVYEDTEVETTTGENTNFGMKGGVFYPYSTAGTITAFHAYLSTKLPSQAKSIMLMLDESSATGIQDINTDADNANTVYYNLNGVRTENPTKGIYVSNGKKVIIK